MKIIKLLLLVVVVIGVVYGITQIPNISTDKPNLVQNPIFQKLQAKVDSIWNDGNTNWNSETYDNTKAKIITNCKGVPAGGYENLREMNANLAVKSLHNSMMAEFAKSNCDQSKVKQMHDDLLNVLIADPDNKLDATKNQAVINCKETYNLYVSICDFGKLSHTLSPNFNRESGTFNDFNRHQTSVRERRDAFKNHTRWNNIKNISSINNILNDVETKLTTARNVYPKSVARAIEHAFSDEEYSDTNLKKLNKAAKNFLDAFPNNSAIDNFVKDFKRKVKEEANKTQVVR